MTGTLSANKIVSIALNIENEGNNDISGSNGLTNNLKNEVSHIENLKSEVSKLGDFIKNL